MYVRFRSCRRSMSSELCTAAFGFEINVLYLYPPLIGLAGRIPDQRKYASSNCIVWIFYYLYLFLQSFLSFGRKSGQFFLSACTIVEKSRHPASIPHRRPVECRTRTGIFVFLVKLELGFVGRMRKYRKLL